MTPLKNKTHFDLPDLDDLKGRNQFSNFLQSCVEKKKAKINSCYYCIYDEWPYWY